MQVTMVANKSAGDHHHLKQYLLLILRSVGLLGVAERLYRDWSVWRVGSENRKFCREHPNFIPPPPTAMHDAYGSTSFAEYWQLGESLAALLAHLILRYQSSPRRVLEWGCGPARILRHLPPLLPKDTGFFGTDYNKQSISWCKGAIKNVTFTDNELAPPLPFADAYFDAIYAVSVLTHLSAAQQDAWINELRRVLHPSGCLILTTNGEQSATILLPKELARFRNEGIVIRSGVDEGRRCFLAYHHPEYVRTHLFSGLQICEHIPGFAEADAIGQDIWVLRKID